MKTALPFLRSEYFHERSERIVFDSVVDYVNKYQTTPTRDALIIELNENDNVGKDYDTVVEVLDDMDSMTVDDLDPKWRIDHTEKFCQDKAIYNSIMESIQILDGKTKKDKGAIPTLLTEALSVSFDSHIGHDYIEDADARYE